MNSLSNTPPGSGSPRSLSWVGLAITATFPAAVFLALAAKTAIRHIALTPSLTAFRSGHLALDGQTKAGDSAFVVVLFATLVVVGAVVYRAARTRQITPITRDFLLVEAVLAALVVVPFVLGVGRPLLDIIDSPWLLVFLLQIPPIIFLCVLWWSASKSDEVQPLQRSGRSFLWLWVAAATPLSAFGILIALRHRTSSSAWLNSPEQSIVVAGFIAVALTVVLGVIAVRFPATGHIAQAWSLVTLSILATPLLLPPRVAGAGVSHLLTGVDLSRWKLLLMVVAGLVVAETVARGRFGVPREAAGRVSSVAIAVLVVPLRAIYELPRIPADDYHFGEVFTPYILWKDFGQLPGSDLFLPRGWLSNVAPGLANGVLNDGSAAMLQYGRIAVALMVVTLSHLALRHAIGFPLATASVGLLAFSEHTFDGDLLSVSLMVLVLSMIVKRVHPVSLGVGATAAVAVSLLVYPLMGAATGAVLVGVLVVALIGAVFGKSGSDRKYGASFALLAIVSSVAILMTPLRGSLVNAVRYVAYNAAANNEAHGIALDNTLRTPFAIGQVLSMSFVLAGFLSLWLIWQRRDKILSPSWPQYATIAVCAVPGVLALGLSGRYLGRIDAGEWLIRTGSGTIVLAGLVVPAVAQLVLSEKKRVIAVFLGIAAILAVVIVPVGQGGLVRNAVGGLERPKVWDSSNFVEAVPRLGIGLGDITHMASVAALGAITEDLPEGEPVLNLSNRNTLAAYLGWTSPIAYLAPYNIESSASEVRVIRSLEGRLPRYAFIGPGPQHDGLSLSLRNPLVANWLMAHYTPWRCGDFTWAIRNEARWLEGETRSAVADEHDLRCEEPLQVSHIDRTSLWAMSIGAPVNLGFIPHSWGTRSAQLQDVKDVVFVSEVIGPATAQTLYYESEGDESEVGPSGLDLLRLEVDCPSNPEANRPAGRGSRSWGNTLATLEWEVGDGMPAGMSTFEWGFGEFLVPLDAYPSWISDASSRFVLTLSIPVIDCFDGWAVIGTLQSRPVGD